MTEIVQRAHLPIPTAHRPRSELTGRRSRHACTVASRSGYRPQQVGRRPVMRMICRNHVPQYELDHARRATRRGRVTAMHGQRGPVQQDRGHLRMLVTQRGPAARYAASAACRAPRRRCNAASLQAR